MSGSQEESIQDRDEGYSSDSGSIDGYADELPQQQEEDTSPQDSEDEDKLGTHAGQEEGFRIIEDKNLLQKLKEEQNSEPVPKNQRCTLDCISKYEYARVVGMRAMQVASNAPLYIHIPIQELQKLSALQIAEREFKERRLPYMIRRFLPNGTYEDWSLCELDNKNI